MNEYQLLGHLNAREALVAEARRLLPLIEKGKRRQRKWATVRCRGLMAAIAVLEADYDARKAATT